MVEILSIWFFVLVAGFSSNNSVFANSKTFLPNTFRADFEQVIKSTVSKKTKVTTGYLEYEYPGKFRFENLEPELDKLTFVSNSKKTWYYTPPFFGEPGELKVSKSNSLSKFFDSLKKGLVSNKNYKVFSLKNGKRLEFSKKKVKDMGILSAELIFASPKSTSFDELKSIILVKTDKSRTKLNFKKIKSGLVFKKDNFTFVVPKNTRVSD